MENETFVCGICGLDKNIAERPNPAIVSYDRDCWNAYQALRRRTLQDGKKFSMAIYRELRREAGLPVPRVEPSKGRPTVGHPRSKFFSCVACNSLHMMTNRGYKICISCLADYREWKKVEPKLTIPLYLGLKESKQIITPPFKQQRTMRSDVQEYVQSISSEHIAILEGEYKA